MTLLTDPATAFLAGMGTAFLGSFLSLSLWLWFTDLCLDVEEIANFAP